MSTNNLNNDELFRLFLDGELNEEQERRALHMIADDPEMRSMLRFERTLTQSFNSEQDPDSFSVPENFSSNVMDRIRNLDGEREGDNAKGLSLFKSSEVSIRPIYAAAAAILM
ncbi:MAG TPA: hypothetical protein VKM36_02910, partial [Balneolaceae bacterium]|nr:hypothetical protein [Balneolaceae bacterium]